MPTGAEVRRLASPTLALVCAAGLASCGDTLQDRPIGPAPLESVIVKSRFPVYWLGSRFAGMRITGVVIDPGGAVTLRYGDCLVGGQYTCVTPLALVTSPDNSFLPGATLAGRTLRVRGAQTLSALGGGELAIRTGSVIVSVRAERPALARRAALLMTPVNKVGLPLQTLPTAVPDTGFDRLPLPSQLPPGQTIPQPRGA